MPPRTSELQIPRSQSYEQGHAHDRERSLRDTRKDVATKSKSRQKGLPIDKCVAFFRAFLRAFLGSNWVSNAFPLFVIFAHNEVPFLYNT